MNAKKYDREDLLERAVELFRRQGYSDTSTAELVAELGVNRKSMYAEFGSKQGLFEAALEYYDQHHLTRVLGPLESQEAGPNEIRKAFQGYARASEGWASGKGCLLCNTAVERAALDPGAARYVEAYIDRVTAAFRSALSNGQQRGEVSVESNIEDLAAYFMTALIGFAACVRAQASPEQMHAACRVTVGVLEGAMTASD